MKVENGDQVSLGDQFEELRTEDRTFPHSMADRAQTPVQFTPYVPPQDGPHASQPLFPRPDQSSQAGAEEQV